MRRLAIYAHFGAAPAVSRHVLYYLEQIVELGFEICFVSNSEISEASKAEVQRFCGRVIVRENVGLDFCMWQRGISEYALESYDELLLTNSSIVGPLRPLAPLWQNPITEHCDFWGLTDNVELRPHLQSYFLVFKENVLRSHRFRDFWSTVLPYRSKAQIILAYEIGLSVWLSEGGFRWRAVFSHALVIDRYKERRTLREKARDAREGPPTGNATMCFPDILIELGMPFLKTVILRDDHRPRSNSRLAFEWLEQSAMPADVIHCLRQEIREESHRSRSPNAALKAADQSQSLTGADRLDLGTRNTNQFYKNVDPCGITDSTLVDFVHRHAGNRILDLGSGPGGYSRLLTELGHSCVALDINPDYVEMARKLGVEAATYDGHHIPLEDSSVDTVIAIEVLEHVPDPAPLIREIARVTKGNFIASVPNCSQNFSPAPVVFEHMLDVDHKNFFTRTSFKELLECGFKHVDVQEIVPVDRMLIDNLAPFALRKFYSVMAKFGLVRTSKYFRLLATASVK